MATHSFPVPIHSSKNNKNRSQTQANILICLLDHVYEAPFANMKMECQRWPDMSLILWRFGTQYVAVIKPVWSNYGTHLVESYCKESNISDTNWLRYRFFIIFDQNLVEYVTSSLSYFAYFKTWISLEQKEIFENSKQHFSSHAVYLFMFKNGFDRKDAFSS